MAVSEIPSRAPLSTIAADRGPSFAVERRPTAEDQPQQTNNSRVTSDPPRRGRRIQEELGDLYRPTRKNRPDESGGTQGVSEAVSAEDTAIATQVSPQQDVGSAQASETTAVAAANTNNELRALAEKYVDQFAREAGVTFTAEDRSARIDEIYSFYSKPEREGRLERIVFQ